MLDVKVIDHATPYLKRYADELSDLRRPLTIAGEYMFKATVKNFQSQGRRIGYSWAPLKASTIRRRRKGSSVPLQDTRRLLRSVTARGGDNVYQLTDSSLTMGSSLPQARIHNQGGTIRRTSTGKAARAYVINIPKRTFLEVVEADERAIVGIFKKFATEAKDA